MSRASVEQLMDRWINEPAFAAQLRKDPEGAVRGMNVELNEDEWAALRRVDWSLSDEELRLRARANPMAF
jgi:hypothetical protein